MAASNEREADENARLSAGPQHVLFAETPKGITIGVVSDSEPSPLALLATGVAGMAARNVLRERVKQASRPVAVATKPPEQGK